MNMLDNRELAIAIWLLVFATYAISKAEMRRAGASFLRAICQPYTLILFTVFAFYIVLEAWFLSWIGFWNTALTKITGFWAITTLAAIAYKARDYISNPPGFRAFAIEAIKSLALVEFLIALVPFSIWIELVLVPMTAILGALYGYAENRREHAQVKTVLIGLLALIAFSMVTRTLYVVVSDIEHYATWQSARELASPFLLSLLLTPFLVGLTAYIQYDLLYSRLKLELKDLRFQRFALLSAIVAFGIRWPAFKIWKQLIAIDRPRDKQQLSESIREALSTYRRSNERLDDQPEAGWNPYQASKFLDDYGLSADTYMRQAGGHDYFGCSATRKAEPNSILNYFSYNIEGNRDVAKLLTLSFEATLDGELQDNLARFTRIASALFESALQAPTPSLLIQKIADQSACQLKSGNTEICFAVSKHANAKFAEFEITIRQPEYASPFE